MNMVRAVGMHDATLYRGEKQCLQMVREKRAGKQGGSGVGTGAGAHRGKRHVQQAREWIGV